VVHQSRSIFSNQLTLISPVPQPNNVTCAKKFVYGNSSDIISRIYITWKIPSLLPGYALNPPVKMSSLMETNTKLAKDVMTGIELERPTDGRRNGRRLQNLLHDNHAESRQRESAGLRE
jgi:hypothetical protein